MDAFVLAEEKGVYGIELDFRWTRDLVPVVVHDPDLVRVFGMDAQTAEHDFESLKGLCSAVPSLQQVVERFGKKMHLMIEVKHEHYPNPEDQNTILEAILSKLIPGQDYHLISLDPEMLELIECVPDHAKMPVAELNVGKLSEIAFEKNIGGFCFIMCINTLKAFRRASRAGSSFVFPLSFAGTLAFPLYFLCILLKTLALPLYCFAFA